MKDLKETIAKLRVQLAIIEAQEDDFGSKVGAYDAVDEIIFDDDGGALGPLLDAAEELALVRATLEKELHRPWSEESSTLDLAKYIAESECKLWNQIGEARKLTSQLRDLVDTLDLAVEEE